jgi:hypothetical protein
MEIEPGLCYLPVAGPNEKKHLHIVLTYPSDDDEIIVVSLSTLRQHSDTTVVLRAGDHPFVTHDTVVEYRMAAPTPARILSQRLDSGLYRLYGPMPAQILERIQEGVMASRFTRMGIKRRWQHFGL